MYCAAMYTGQHQFAILGFMQVDVEFHAAERAGNVVHDLVDEFVQVENGADLLRCFLQLQQFLNANVGKSSYDVRAGLNGDAGAGHGWKPPQEGRAVLSPCHSIHI